MSRVRLTPALQAQIVASIRAGGYFHVAAQAWGVPRRILLDWLARGEAPKARPPYASFARELRRAVAQARLRAETFALDNDPKAWLEHGPGRDRPDNPGWSGSGRAAPPAAEAEPNPWRSPDVMAMLREMLEALAPTPEARLRIVPIISRQNVPIPACTAPSAAA